MSTPQQIRVSASLELAAHATQLLRTAGLIDGSRHAVSPQRLVAANAKRQPPLIRVSIPVHFGVELMLLTGAVLRPLRDRQVMFMGLCGTIDAELRDRFDSASLEELKRYANQLPKHRMSDLYPLFCLIGAWSGIARGVLDHIFTEKTTVIRRMPAIPLPDHRRSNDSHPMFSM
jgi:aromatic ring-opening dioxygenase catalytic subunit (LigB family)